MAVIEFARIKQTLKTGHRLMGLDLGTKTIGLAISDVTLTIASPLETLKKGKFTKDAESLDELIRQHEIGGLVFGLPVSMDGTEGPRCQSTRQFAANLLERTDIPIAFWD